MLELLSKDQLSEIHASSLEALESVGIMIAGAKVDRHKQLVRIPSYLVDETIRKTPKSLILGARNPKHDLCIERGSIHTRPASGYTQVLDSEGIFRNATRKDLETAT